MNFRKFRKFKKNAKALSPVIATIILIAVTVAVSVVVAAWMGALTIGFMGNAEQAKITNVVLSNSANGQNELAAVTVQNTGSATVTITSATIDGSTAAISGVSLVSGTIQASYGSTGQALINKGNTVEFTLTVSGSATTSIQFSNSAQYTITLMTAKGNTETTQTTYSGP
jgi:flagellin-like protein